MNYTRMTKSKAKNQCDEIALRLHRGNGYHQITYASRGIFARAQSYKKSDGSTEVIYYVAEGSDAGYTKATTWIKALESLRDDIVETIAPRNALRLGARIHRLAGVGLVPISVIADAVEKILFDASDLLFEDDRKPWTTMTVNRALTLSKLTSANRDKATLVI
jgi:hypothetical protein